jgi:hypothetical protein
MYLVNFTLPRWPQWTLRHCSEPAWNVIVDQVKFAIVSDISDILLDSGVHLWVDNSDVDGCGGRLQFEVFSEIAWKRQNSFFLHYYSFKLIYNAESKRK